MLWSLSNGQKENAVVELERIFDDYGQINSLFSDIVKAPKVIYHNISAHG